MPGQQADLFACLEVDDLKPGAVVAEKSVPAIGSDRNQPIGGRAGLVEAAHFRARARVPYAASAGLHGHQKLTIGEEADSLDRLHWPCRRSHRSEEHTSELQSHVNLVCRLLLE